VRQTRSPSTRRTPAAHQRAGRTLLCEPQGRTGAPSHSRRGPAPAGAARLHLALPARPGAAEPAPTTVRDAYDSAVRAVGLAPNSPTPTTSSASASTGSATPPGRRRRSATPWPSTPHHLGPEQPRGHRDGPRSAPSRGRAAAVGRRQRPAGAPAPPEPRRGAAHPRQARGLLPVRRRNRARHPVWRPRRRGGPGR
jgi:hypothetical protein